MSVKKFLLGKEPPASILAINTQKKLFGIAKKIAS